LVGIPDPGSLAELEFDAGWVHDLGSFTVAASLEGLPRDVAMRECSAFWEGVLNTVNCQWISKPDLIRRASNKLFQLQTAERLGIPIPDYLISNDPKAATEFCSRHTRVIVKSLSTGFLRYADQELKFYTRRLGFIDDQLENYFSAGPIIFQEEVDRRCELRIIVIDGQCFTVQFDTCKVPEHPVDIRQLDFTQHRHLFTGSAAFPELEQLSLKLLEFLGLSYGGFDWVVSRAGNAYFLECNPLGSFKWYELCSGYPITASISNSLLRRAKSNAQQ
jgi:hypothetical protein